MEMLAPNRPGYILSGSVHAALLVAILVSFTQAQKFDDAQESVPVETVTDQQFNQVMKGEKTAKEVKPTPKADKVADLTESHPQPPLNEAKRDIPTPPPPLKRIADPGEAQTPTVPTPPQRAAALPPPEPPKAEPVKPPPPPPLPPIAQRPPPEDAEAIMPKPVPRPVPRPEPPKAEVAKPEPKKEVPFKPDQLAKLLQHEKQEEDAKPVEKPTLAKSRPKSGDETEETPHKFDVADINKLLSKEAPQHRSSTAGQLQQMASLGSPTASASAMSPSLWGQLDGLLQDQYKQCWSFIGLGNLPKYVPEIKVQYAQDGTLVGQPVLMNPPSDPQLKTLAESAMRAVRRCNPLNIPAVFQPFYDEWRDRIVRFDPDELS